AGQTLTWQLPALPPNQAGTLTARFQLSPTAQLGDSLAASARLLPLAGDQTPADNVSLVRQLITGSFDPNDILVNHEQLTPQQVQQGEWLEYTIRFQNTGTDTAFSILLRDTLPTHQLNLSTLQLQAASHSPAWQLSPTGILTVRFPGIHLPHQAIDDAGSNGFFRFRVRTRTSLVAGNRIPNRAHIYFDFNPPVATNTALTTITSPLGLSEAAGPADLRVWPNPATGTLHVEWSHDSPAVLTLLDALGRPVRTGATGPRARTTLHLAGLPPGLYLLRALTGHQAGTRRVVIR
ncbi:MAG TPA: T9SS type A sorting domain-containing protein, partial [bacterium]|nr:T9SS type A sorting domain-containing protein [bacterium]